MFILPVGHEEDELRRWPWVSIAIAGVCILVFLGLSLSGRKAERLAIEAARQVFVYAADKPHLVIDEDLLFGETASLQGEVRADHWSSFDGGEPDDAEIGRQQAELDRLTSRWRRLTAAVPIRTLGLVPAELRLSRLVSHIFVHAGFLHLIANLFFFWLLAPPLEDVWGRPLFAAFFLATGIVAGILWVARYPNSSETVVGASGAIAGLMGAFMVRFWRTKIRFVGFVWMSLKIYAGSFKAPAWIMLALWFLRELALASLFEPHLSAGGGVATRAHLYGFGFGALAAAAIGGLRIEQRWIRPKLLAATGEIQYPALERALDCEREGRPEEAWSLIEQEATSRPDSQDAVLYWWSLACKTGREAEVAPHLVGVIRGELQSGHADLAWQHWQELRQRLPRFETPPALRVAIAESLVAQPDSANAIAELLATARAEIGSSGPPALMARLARTSARAKLPGAASLCARIAGDPNLPESIRVELRELAANTTPDTPAGSPATHEGENR